MGKLDEDQALMKRFVRRGDRRAFEQLAGRWDRRVFGFLAKACGSLEAAEDLRQEVFSCVSTAMAGVTIPATRSRPGCFGSRPTS